MYIGNKLRSNWLTLIRLKILGKINVRKMSFLMETAYYSWTVWFFEVFSPLKLIKNNNVLKFFCNTQILVVSSKKKKVLADKLVQNWIKCSVL